MRIYPPSAWPGPDSSSSRTSSQPTMTESPHQNNTSPPPAIETHAHSPQKVSPNGGSIHRSYFLIQSAHSNSRSQQQLKPHFRLPAGEQGTVKLAISPSCKPSSLETDGVTHAGLLYHCRLPKSSKGWPAAGASVDSPDGILRDHQD